ncbi:MAG: FKBP-type peptidyl-prolyl cis-trans isomerase [Melioribacteraceae bacterium]|nr:FKBP-type peptidyl-prolyl cis-trans isomerase [Melioribacteraceae bacterium]
MKQILLIISAAVLILSCTESNNRKEIEISTKKDSVSYSIGIDIGKNLKRQEIEIEPDVMLQGFLDAQADTSKLTDEEIMAVMTNFQKEMREKQQNKNKMASEKNKAEAEAFFTENKNKDGVISLESGIQYKVIKSGSGKSPKISSTVETHYSGRLLDGTEFDSSYKRGNPISFAVTGVIKGWTEILQLMKEGDKWEVYIPSELAYGERGSPPMIGPNAALIFEMELIKVK